MTTHSFQRSYQQNQKELDALLIKAVGLMEDRSEAIRQIRKLCDGEHITLAKLKDEASQRGIAGYSRMNKQTLLMELSNVRSRNGVK